jgi:hypothetical protein
MTGEHITKCNHKKCKKKKECFRFHEAKGELILFKNICSKENEYKWFIERKKEIITK